MTPWPDPTCGPAGRIDSRNAIYGVIMKRLLGIIALLILAVAPTAATAHEGNANYRSEITSIQPQRLADGLTLETYNFDDGVRLSNETGKEVVVIGYQDEPYVRITADGLVQVNLNSPTFYLNEDRWADVEPPARADPEAEPEWETVDETGQYSWHDHRSHYMSEQTPPQVTDKSVETKVFDYGIPLRVDGEPVKAVGTLTWVGSDERFPIIPFIVLGIVAVGGLVFLLLRRRGNGDDQDPSEGPGGESSGDEAW